MKRIKVAHLVVCSCAIALVAVGCGGSGDDGAEPAQTDAERLSGNVKVWDIQYDVSPEYKKTIDRIDAQFEKANPDVTVERIGQPEATITTVLRTAFLSNEVPDMIYNNAGIATLAFSDSLEVLDPRISPELEDVIVNWEQATPGLREDGPRYCMPSPVNGAAFYYNKKLFEKAGLPTDFHPESWSELREAGEKLEAAGILPFADGGKIGAITAPWFFGLGLQTTMTDNERSDLYEGKTSYTSEGVAEAFDPLIELYDAGLYSPNFFNEDLEEGFARFEDGKGAMVLGLWGLIGSFKQFNAALGEENIGMFRTPGSPNWTTFGLCSSLPTDAKNKEAAWALMEFEASKPSVEEYVKEGNLFPNRTDVSVPAGSPVQAEELGSALHNRETEPFSLAAMALGAYEVMEREFPEILQGRTSVADVQKQMQEEAEKEQGS